MGLNWGTIIPGYDKTKELLMEADRKRREYQAAFEKETRELYEASVRKKQRLQDDFDRRSKELADVVMKEGTKLANSAVDTAKNGYTWTKNAASDSYDWTKDAAEDSYDWTSHKAEDGYDWSVDTLKEVEKLAGEGYDLAKNAAEKLNDLLPFARVNRSNWMGSLSDNTMLTDMSIPGTHDSACFNPVTGAVMGQTQMDSFYVQLMSGIRFFDIRGRDDLSITSHDFVLTHDKYLPQPITFVSVLAEMLLFLKLNNDETIIIQLKSDAGSVAGLDKISHQVMVDFGLDNFVLESSLSNVNLRKARGKIVVLNRFSKESKTGGMYIAYENNRYTIDEKKKGSQSKTIRTCLIQDFYDVSVGDKQTRIRNFFDNYNCSSEQRLRINFLTIGAEFSVTRISPLVSATLTNFAFVRYLRKNSKKYAGVFMLDAVGLTKSTDEIIARVINNNK